MRRVTLWLPALLLLTGLAAVGLFSRYRTGGSPARGSPSLAGAKSTASDAGSSAGRGDAELPMRTPHARSPAEASASLIGLVLNPDGGPQPGARVLVVGQSSFVLADENGVFTSPPLPEGQNFLVWAEHAAAKSRIAVLKAGRDLGRSVLQLELPGRLLVTVTDAVDGGAIDSAWVALAGQPLRTNSEGVASFDVTEAGELKLEVSKVGYASTLQLVTLSRLNRGPAILHVALRRGRDVTGWVEDAAGRPVAGAKIRLFDATQVTGLATARSTVSAPDGRFAFDAILAGRYRLQAHAPGSGFGEGSFVLAEAAAAPEPHIVLQRGARVACRVIDLTGASVARAEVVLRGPVDALLPTQDYRCHTDVGGRCTLDDLPPMHAVVRASTAEESSPVQAVQSRREKPTEVVLVLGGGLSIAGTVVDGDGTPVPGAQIVARRVRDLERSLPQSLARDGTATSDAAGAFELRGLDDGVHVLLSAAAGKSPYDALGALRSLVQAPAGVRGVRIVLPDESGIRGEAIFEDGTAPATLSIWVDGRGPLEAPTQYGQFHLADVPPGARKLSFASASESQVAELNVDVPAGAELDVGVVKLTRAASVSGFVVNERGDPIAAAEVMAGARFGGDGATVAVPEIRNLPDFSSTRTDAAGAFKLVLRGEEPLILADHPQYGRSALAPASAGPLRLVLSNWCEVKGRLTKDGHGVAGAFVSLVRDDGRIRAGSQVASSATDAIGNYVLSRVEPGKYVPASAVLDARGYTSIFLDAPLTFDSCNQLPTLNLELGLGVEQLTIRRQVRIASPPLPITVFGPDRFIEALLSDADSLTLDGLTTGAHEVCPGNQARSSPGCVLVRLASGAPQEVLLDR